MKLNLNYKEMPVLSYSQRKELPSEPGIYYVGNHECPVRYVGLARNLKKRHVNHHRQRQFEEIEGVEIRCQVIPEHILVNITDLRKVLIRLEKQAINHYKPPLNDTLVPDQPAFTTSRGPVYVQTHKVSKEGYCEHFDCQDGDELEINTSKQPQLTRAIKEQRPIFLIASGYYKDYAVQEYPNLSELASYGNDRIYLLLSRFIPYAYEQANCPEYRYAAYGATSKIFVNPYVILNNKPGFEEFRRSYLLLGFTNCEQSSFAKQLLHLGDFKLLSTA